MADLNRQWLLASRPVGPVKESDFSWQEGPVPEPREGQLLVRTLYLSFDPAMRGWMNERATYVPPVRLGAPMRAGAVAQVIESRHPDYRRGELVQGTFGWQDYATVAPGSGGFGLMKLEPGVPPSWYLGVLGITGLTAYFGMLEVANPAAGETVLVSGAAGATGSVAGQLGRLRGARVVGIAGGPRKCDWLTGTAGFDAAIDYRGEDVAARIDALCPEGVDVYFDNVGGELLESVLERLRLRARVALCGAISTYNAVEAPPGPRNLINLVLRRARLEGFLVLDYAEQFSTAIQALRKWVEAGALVHEEDIREGLENAPKTLLRLFAGENLGKQLLRVADAPLPIQGVG